MPGDRRGGGDDLVAGGAVADDADPLAGQIQVLGPGAGVHEASLEVVHAGEVGHVGRRQAVRGR